MVRHIRSFSEKGPKLQKLVLLILLLSSTRALADAEAMYLANAGLMVTHGDTKILFDPLFRNDYGTYQLVPADIEAALMAGEPPFAGIDAVFISHNHGDHFSAADLLDYLRRHQQVKLYAPIQATESLLYFATDDDADVVTRITGLDIQYGDSATELAYDNLRIEAFHIPHSGWPERKPEVHNLAFRVSIDDFTVLHMGDADTRDEHFAIDGERWQAGSLNTAFPPYWYFTSADGRAVLGSRLKPRNAIGVHVPVELDPGSSSGLENRDLFRQPGETRKLANQD